ncbi:MAG: HAMP domain-containing sensor histidine kinase [bacterium]|nr:HAMP domain-containing sensor histidine kinase [bacterium]
MKNLRIFPKMFFYTFAALSTLVILIHALVYFIFPQIYLENRKQEIDLKADQIIENIKGKNLEHIRQTLDFYSQNSEIKAFVEEKNGENELKIEKNIEADLTSNRNSVVIKEREIETNSKEKISVKFISTADMEKNAEELVFRFLPFSVLLSFFLSITISLIYAKIITKNIQEIKNTTTEMMKLNRAARLKINSNNEVGELKSQINELYATLLQLIDDSENKNREILRLEKLKSNFFKGASHELKTPLSSLKIILENMKYNIGKYRNKEKYIENCIEIVDELTQNIGQILSNSSFEYLKNDEENLIIKNQLAEVLANYDFLIEQKKLVVQNSLKQEKIYISKTALKIILSNLISNAVKYSPQNGAINIGVENNQLFIENSYSKIESLDLKNFFEKSSNSKKEASGGFGLYIVRNILQNYHIKYRVEKTQIGVKFLIDLSKK